MKQKAQYNITGTETAYNICTGMEIAGVKKQSNLCKGLKIRAWGKVGHKWTSGITEAADDTPLVTSSSYT